jgi:hypothetical protein
MASCTWNLVPTTGLQPRWGHVFQCIRDEVLVFSGRTGDFASGYHYLHDGYRICRDEREDPCGWAESEFPIATRIEARAFATSALYSLGLFVTGGFSAHKRFENEALLFAADGSDGLLLLLLTGLRLYLLMRTLRSAGIGV